jgi:type II secretory pathway pseudopilin PulG
MRILRSIVSDERGDVEDIPGLAIVLVGILCPLIAVVIFMGRYGLAENTVQSAAAAAARDASLSARAAAELALSSNVNCQSLDVLIGGDGLHTTLGQTGTVTATITCRITTADLSFPLIPGSLTITHTAASPVDPYRQR